MVELALALAMIAALGACGEADPTQSDEYVELDAELDVVRDERDTAADAVTELEADHARLDGRVDDLMAQVESAEAESARALTDLVERRTGRREA